jgi:hypothetical protein
MLQVGNYFGSYLLFILFMPFNFILILITTPLKVIFLLFNLPLATVERIFWVVLFFPTSFFVAFVV